MTKKAATIGERFDRIDSQLERMAKAVVKGFDQTSKHQEAVKKELKQSIDIYARAVDAYAKQAETYMQEMLAHGVSFVSLRDVNSTKRDNISV